MLTLKKLDTGSVLWSVDATDRNAKLKLQENDNHLVLYSGSNNAIWATGVYTGQHGDQWTRNGYLMVQDDGNLVVYDGSDRMMWESHTAGGTTGSGVKHRISG